MPRRMEGIEAIRGKHEWWYANNEIHESRAEGPFVAEDDEHFAVIFHMDITPKGGERMKMSEVAYYTVRDGKIAEERFYFPPMG